MTSVNEPSHLFYRLSSPVPPPPLPPDFEFEFWRPTWRRPLAPGLSSLTATVWFCFHLLRLFANRGYSAGVIRHNGKIVHVTMVFPGFFRFPFMAPTDLQLGALWTDPVYRGRRLAGIAVGRLLEQLAPLGGNCWYITDGTNAASQQVAARAGFLLVGRGAKVPRAGLRALGAYRITTPLP